MSPYGEHGVSWSSAHPHGQRHKSVGDERLHLGGGDGRIGEAQGREAGEQRGQGDRRLQAGQRSADAVVHAVAEGEMVLVDPGGVEVVRVPAVASGVAARGGVRREDRVAPGDGDPVVQLDVLDGVPQGRLAIEGAQRSVSSTTSLQGMS